MMIITGQRRKELIIILALSAGLAFFTFQVIPASVSGLDGFSASENISPKDPLYLICLLASLILGSRLLRILIAPDSKLGVVFEEENSQKADYRQAIKIIALCLLFSLILIEYFGFYASGFLFILVLIWGLGEHRPLPLLATPIIVMFVIYIMFGQVFEITLPRGIWTEGWLDLLLK